MTREEYNGIFDALEKVERQEKRYCEQYIKLNPADENRRRRDMFIALGALMQARQAIQENIRIDGENAENADNLYTIRLDRSKICDLMLACTDIKIDARNEMENGPNCPEYRREHVLPGTIEKWQDLHDMLEAQLDAQDMKQSWYVG